MPEVPERPKLKRRVTAPKTTNATKVKSGGPKPHRRSQSDVKLHKAAAAVAVLDGHKTKDGAAAKKRGARFNMGQPSDDEDEWQDASANASPFMSGRASPSRTERTEEPGREHLTVPEARPGSSVNSASNASSAPSSPRDSQYAKTRLMTRVLSRMKASPSAGDLTSGPVSSPPNRVVPPADLSRTQQKLNLQRASSSLEPAAAPVPLVNSDATPSKQRDPRIARHLEKVALEYLLVRRFQSPLASSYARCRPRRPQLVSHMSTAAVPLRRAHSELRMSSSFDGSSAPVVAEPPSARAGLAALQQLWEMPVHIPASQ